MDFRCFCSKPTAITPPRVVPPARFGRLNYAPERRHFYDHCERVTGRWAPPELCCRARLRSWGPSAISAASAGARSRVFVELDLMIRAADPKRISRCSRNNNHRLPPPAPKPSLPPRCSLTGVSPVRNRPSTGPCSKKGKCLNLLGCPVSAIILLARPRPSPQRTNRANLDRFSRVDGEGGRRWMPYWAEVAPFAGCGSDR